MRNPLFADVKYLTINERDENWGLTVTTAGYQSILPQMPYPPDGHPSQYRFNPLSGRILQEYQLVYITEGEGSFRSGSAKPVALHAGMLIMLFPGEWHTYCPRKEAGWNTYWVGFRGSFPDSLAGNRFFSKKEPVYNLGFNEQIVDLFKRIIDITKQERTGFQQVVSSMAIHLLGLIYYISRNHLFEDKEIVTRIEKARMMMREHPDGEICPHEIARSLNMSYSWFRRTFKQYTGLSPSQYQLQIKIERAKALLTSSSKSVKEIAFLLDFESANYFTLFFRQKTGMTPGTFRKMSHGKQ